MNKFDRVYAVIVAAGAGKRMATNVPKQLLSYGGSTVLGTCISKFAGCGGIDGIVVVSPQDGSLDEEYKKIIKSCEECGSEQDIHIVRGGAERSDSVRAGLAKCAELAAGAGIAQSDFGRVAVLIHDAARPGVTRDIIKRNIEALKECRAVVTCMPAVDSVRVINEPDDERRLNLDDNYHIMNSTVLERSRVFNVQTPQSFALSDILAAYDQAASDGYVGTDDASIASNAGIDVAIVAGGPSNNKITTIEDMPMTTRVGTGFDVHKLVSGRRLILCGTPVPNELGLLGHSDADVATHALMDAMLGAAGLGDIGRLFPDSDEKYKDADSMKLLAEVREELADYNINNVDITIICERPKLAPYNQQMRENIARVLGIGVQAVSVKATTTEGLGFTGQGEGIAAIATCTIEGRI